MEQCRPCQCSVTPVLPFTCLLTCTEKCEMLPDSMLQEIKRFATTWIYGIKGMHEVPPIFEAASPFQLCATPVISKVAEMAEKPVDSRLKWFRHMVRDTTTTQMTRDHAILCLVLVMWVHSHLDMHHLPLCPTVLELRTLSMHPKLCLPLPG